MDIKNLISSSNARMLLPNAALRFLRLLCVVALFSPVRSADAQKWDFEPYIELAATYTTNLFLAEEGLEESDYIGQLVPGFSVVRDEGRFTTNTEYRALGLFFASDSDLNTVYHQLRSASTINTVAERFFIDVNAAIEQAVVDPTATIPTSNVIATNNLGDVTTASVNPYLILPLGGSEAFMRLDYAYDIARYENFGLQTFSRVDDYDQQTGRFFLGTRQREAGLEWSLSYNFQSIDYVNVSDYDYERAQAALGVQLSRSFRLIGLGGRETDLLVGRDIGGLDSEFWEAGFRINAGSNSVVEFRTGERFFGDSYFGNIELEGRRVEFTTSYTENPTTSAEGMLGGLVIPFNPNPASSEDQEQLPIDEIILAPIRAEVYVSKMWRSRFTVNSARTEIYFSYFQEDRDFVDDLDLVGVSQDGQSSLAIGFIRELGPRTSMELVGRLFEYEYTDSDDVTQVASLEFGITRNIGTGTELGLTLRHAEQDTDSVSQFGNYVESAVDLRLVKTF